MKYCLTLILTFPLFLAAQDPAAAPCKLNRETDPFTKETKISTGFIPLDGGSVTIDGSKAEIDLLFSVEGADRCFDNNSVAYIFFEGSKSKLSNRNGGSMNCEGLFHFIFRNGPSPVSLLQKMTTKKITHFIFSTTGKKEITVTVNEQDRQMLMDLASCLVTEAKTLIK